jgi:sec-independent protein translocase protein TatB
MFEVGFLELVIIGVVALLVFGPERLPDLARNVGRWVGHARQVVWSVRSEIERELQAPDIKRLNQSIESSRIERWLERGGQGGANPPGTERPPAERDV